VIAAGPPLRLLVLHPALAPYRVDAFNALSRRTALRLVFLEENVSYQAFDQARLRSLLEFEPGYLLSGIEVGRRTIRFGIGGELGRHRPDVVVTTEFGQAALAVQAHRRLGAGAFAHVVATEDNPASVQEETRLHALGRRVLLPLVDGVLTYSAPASAMYRERFGATAPVTASPLVQSEAVLQARLVSGGGAARALAARHGLLGRRVLLCVGRLAPEKRADRLVDAVGRLRAAFPELVLALVGDGPERAALERRAAERAPAGSVLFAGRLEGEALSAWYRLGTVFALASAFEPFGAVVNEALLAGLPAVVSDRAGAHTLVADGQNGAVVEAARPEALDAALAGWLRREPPLGEAQLATPRPSRMLSTFAQAMDAFVEGLEAARRHRLGARAARPAGSPGGGRV
jgi:glycosyltransferase involved in cell wall biosynthesis